jgi:exonuclease VII small subunit
LKRLQLTRQTNYLILRNNMEQEIKISDMLRQTGENYSQFMQQVANHIDKIESQVIRLEQRILELEEAYDANRKSE